MTYSKRISMVWCVAHLRHVG